MLALHLRNLSTLNVALLFSSDLLIDLIPVLLKVFLMVGYFLICVPSIVLEAVRKTRSTILLLIK